MIRDGDWKLVYYVNDMAELYNLRADPGELRNLAFDTGSAPLLARMKARLFEWYKPPARTR
jgi:choline-sulfatase